MPGRRAVGRSDEEVLAVLSTAGVPLGPGAVLDRFSRTPVHATITTTLRRLRDKRAQVGLPGPGGSGFHRLDAQLPATITARRARRVSDTGAERSAVPACFVGPSHADAVARTGLWAVEPGDGQQR